MGTFASRGTHRVGNAVIMAAREAREVMLQVAADELEVDPADLETDGTGFIKLKGSDEKKIHIVELALAAHFEQGRTIAGRGIFLKEKSEPVPETGEMDPDSCQAHACTVAEVEVDDETGVVEVLAMYNVYEVGRALNPAMATQQIEGGAWMGISHALFETTEPYYPDREHGPTDFSEYLMPGPADNARDAERDPRAPGRQRAVRRQGHRRDDRERADPGDRERDLRRVRRAARVDAVHAGEDPARARRAGGGVTAAATDVDSVEELGRRFAEQRYFADEGLLTAVHLALVLGRPLALEGEPGVGKTELAKVLAAVLGRELIRLQCYEGLDAGQALYEWDYPKQLLAVRVAEAEGRDVGDLYDERFLLERPLLRTVRGVRGRRAADRRDRPLGLRVRGVPARVPRPTSRSRSRRSGRCAPRGRRSSSSPRTARASCTTRSSAAASTTGSRSPDAERERAILRAQAPGLDDAAADALVEAIKRVRGEKLLKPPGIAETIDWAQGAQTLAREGVPWPAALRRSLGLLLKEQEDLERVAARSTSGSDDAARPRSPASTCTGSSARWRTWASPSARRSRPTSSLALVASPPADVEALYWRARVTLVSRPEDFDAFDAVFDAFFRGGAAARGGGGQPPDEERRDRGAARRRRRRRSRRSSRARARACTRARSTCAHCAGSRRPPPRSHDQLRDLPRALRDGAAADRRAPRGARAPRAGSTCAACSRRRTARAGRSCRCAGCAGRRARAACSC